MPLNPKIKKVLVIGSGPIVIGQAAEFDYAGTQACRALREDGIEIVLVNSNPATIMTDHMMADKIYIEPLTLKTVERIIEKEKPDSILSGLGGQTGLTLCMQLAHSGFLKAHNVTLLGSSPETIDKAEDRQMFKDTMESIGQPCIPSKVVTEVEAALDFANEIGYPVIVRPAFTLGGSGGGIAENEAQLKEIAHNGIAQSPIDQILVERCIAGWKEIEFEVIRDKKGNVITVCSMENFDPVGVHTGDSIVIAPAVTLADKEYQMLRSAALKIIDALKVEGGCNCQFALNPDSFEYAVIEVNPRVSRSSALASKATGYPIAKVATKIAVGYTLDEIKNAVTGTTYAAFEPALDYVAVKLPKWPFDKFVYAKRTLGTQMKATGEVMSISDSFESAIMKAVRGAEISAETLSLPWVEEMNDEAIVKKLHDQDDNRLFVVYGAIKRGVSLETIHEITKIDLWFLNKLKHIAEYELRVTDQPLSTEDYFEGKKLGYLDKSLQQLSGAPLPASLEPTYKMVDTCAGEFAAQTPYFYATYNAPECGGESEVTPFITHKKKSVVVFGSGPIRIGQGIEFDYASVHCVHVLKELGFEVIIVNNNPETVSTDFDTADRLYFEPLNKEDVRHILKAENPYGVVVAFGGQTAIKLTKFLDEEGINIIGTSADSIDMAEDRDRFDHLLSKLNIKRPEGFTVMDTDGALDAAHHLGYPVLMRPSYVLGGQNMIIAFNDADIQEYMKIILAQGIENPVLIDKYLEGREIEVDAIYDGEDVLIPGIMEHIERSGIHSGDSIAVYPATHIDDDLKLMIIDTTKQLCKGLNATGIVNIQYIISKRQIYIIEVNPRASRTVPYLSKVTGVPMVDLAVKVSLGEKLKDLGYGTGVYRTSAYTAVKVPVFSFEKLIDVDTQLGPEMKSTGEVLGIGRDLKEALYKGLVAAGYKMYKEGGVFVTVRRSDKHEIPDLAKKFANLGFELYATEGNAEVIRDAGMSVTVVPKIHENSEFNSMTLLESGKIRYIISTSAKGRIPARDSVRIRRRACMLGIPCLTSIDTANALADSLLSRYSEINTEIIDINNMRKDKMKMKFTKMQACGNDYIYIDCFEQTLDSPESLSVYLSDRHFGVGGDGIVLICPSHVADAKMRMFNLDGSEGNMCGNAIRCVGKYLYDVRKIGKRRLTIETRSGIRTLELMTKDDKVIGAKVDMGPAELDPKKIPVKFEGSSVIDRQVKVGGRTYEITCVSMGNPHCVVFDRHVETMPLETIGPVFENNSIFPERVNTEFVKVLDEHTIKMRVWERGSGETMACGTGACAAVVASVLNGYCPMNEDIRVILNGGELTICYTEDTVYMTGNAEKVYDGIVEI
ncbi:MAG TPA: carbamoyl-phosphate synthase large subunit [Candidatus Scybalocola faecipullorum]|nr:carbamoyl-phosphate synthase large subunit [Candidatus Scybalocola faecipullorum]